MVKVFYDHLVMREEITLELDGYNLSPDQREEIVRIIDETLHTEVLNTILTHLPKDKHRKFLAHLHKNPADPQLLVDLKTEIHGIEEEIQKVSGQVKKEILAEIKRAE